MILSRFSLALALMSAPEAVVGAPDGAATQPAWRDHPSFLAAHAAAARLTADDARDILFIGDSLTERWREAPEVWHAYFGQWSVANLGASGDRVENVLWRVEQGALKRIRPRVLVLLVGTNNTGDHTAAEIHRGIAHLLSRIHEQLPGTQIILIGLLPRGPRLDSRGQFDPGRPRQDVINQLNQTLPTLADGRQVHWLFFGDRFIQPDGTLRPDLMPDQLHLSAAGYRVWAEALQPLLQQLLEGGASTP